MGDLGRAMKAERRRAQNNTSLVGGRKGLFICTDGLVFHCAAEGSFGLFMTSDVECCAGEQGGEAGGLKAAEVAVFINPKVRRNVFVHLGSLVHISPRNGVTFYSIVEVYSCKSEWLDALASTVLSVFSHLGTTSMKV